MFLLDLLRELRKPKVIKYCPILYWTDSFAIELSGSLLEELAVETVQVLKYTAR